jgi:hypothetical protein
MQFAMDSSVSHLAVAVMTLIRLENSIVRTAAYNHRMVSMMTCVLRLWRFGPRHSAHASRLI